MQFDNLAALGAGARIETDLVVIGGGPVGLTIAREFFGTPVRVLILESGDVEEHPSHSGLNAVESIGEPATPQQHAKRADFHSSLSASWRAEEQAFGVRCRGLGGSTRAWAGKSAAFDEIDFAERSWVPGSGWPIARASLDPYLDRAAAILNLGPNCYDDRLWALMGVPAPKPNFDPKIFRAFFWQFARSRIDPMDLMRFGPEFLTFKSPNVRVLLNATATRLVTDEAGGRLQAVEVSSIEGARATILAKACVLAAGGIENPRLLLVSDVGNRHDTVGRYLMDHPGARVGRFPAKAAKAVVERFGFYGLRHGGRTHMYMHGLAPSPELQAAESLLNGAVYMLEDRAPDDPWAAVRRLARGESRSRLADILAIARSPGLLIKGAGMKVFQHRRFPDRLRRAIIDALMQWNTDFVVREFQSRGLPHKLDGVFLDAICEQTPDCESRIVLSERKDALGVPLARVDWRIDEAAQRTLVRLGRLTAEAFTRAGLPAPVLEPWVLEDRPGDAVIIDMGHTAGATRMSADPKLGVVDVDCRVHGVGGLYVAGGSVFPTSGHANPTLMMLALAVRLADHLKGELITPPKFEKGPAQGPKVLVTGATGMIGQKVVEALLAAGCQVRATFSRAPGARRDVEWARLDLQAPGHLAPLVEGCEAVVHLAAELSDTARMERVNVEGTSALLAAAKAAGVRYFGYASSIVVYGSPKAALVDETVPLIDPHRPVADQYIADGHMCEYARTKALSELAIGQVAEGLRVDIYRPTVVVDEARLLESADWALPRRLLTTSHNTNYVMVGDVAAAIVHLLQKGLAPDAKPGVEAYNFADDRAPTFKALLARAHARTGESRYRVPASVPGVFSLLKALRAGHAFSGRRGLGELRFSARKLAGAGFSSPQGVTGALDRALSASIRA